MDIDEDNLPPLRIVQDRGWSANSLSRGSSLAYSATEQKVSHPENSPSPIKEERGLTASKRLNLAVKSSKSSSIDNEIPSQIEENAEGEIQNVLRIANTPNFKNEFALYPQNGKIKNQKLPQIENQYLSSERGSSPANIDGSSTSSECEPNSASFVQASGNNIEFKQTKRLKSQRILTLPQVVEHTYSSQEESKEQSSQYSQMKNGLSIQAVSQKPNKSEYNCQQLKFDIQESDCPSPSNKSEDIQKRNSEQKAKSMFRSLDFRIIRKPKIITKASSKKTDKLSSEKCLSEEGGIDDDNDILFSNLSRRESSHRASPDEIDLIFKEENAMMLERNEQPPPSKHPKFTYHVPPSQPPSYYARSKAFQFTEPSKAEKKFRRLERYTWVGYLAINLVIGSLIIHFYNQFDIAEVDQGDISLYALLGLCYLALVSFNLLIIYPLGGLIIRAIVYPYSFWGSEKFIIGTNSIYYGQDFSALSEKNYLLMRTQMMEPAPKPSKLPIFEKVDKFGEPLDKPSDEKESEYFIKRKRQVYDQLRNMSYYDINQKFRSMVNLSNMFSETNKKVIQNKLSTHEYIDPLFMQLAQILCSMSVLMYRIEVRVNDASNRPIIISLSDYYEENYPNYKDNSIPSIIRSSQNFELLNQFEELCIQFQKVVYLANHPINLLCCRINCFGLAYKNLFHSYDQTELMLAKNFDGRKFWVKAKDGTKLDCMFFPFNDQKVETIEEREAKKKADEHSSTFDPLRSSDKNNEQEYVKYPTVIFFNTNAQCYQQQVHPPNCFWLKFFVSNQINVMAWNYRDYGRSRGMPDPFTCFHDSEAILEFLIKQLGIKGKIGCFGRSLGGTVATHLANNYPQLIEFLFVDRSFGEINKMSESLMLGSYNRFFFNCFSKGWKIESAKNFYEAHCFKMVAQDPNDDMIDQFCALNAQVACLACEDYIGSTRYSSLKIKKSFMAMRMLFKVDWMLQNVLRQQGKHEKKQQLIKRRFQKQQYQENSNYQFEQAGYFAPDFANMGLSQGASEKERTTGYSTDVDHLARSKKFLALENKWKRHIEFNLITEKKLNNMLQRRLKDKFKHYESISISLFKAVVFLNDFAAGMINLGQFVHPNFPVDHDNLKIFVDSLFTYGSGYLDNSNFYTVINHRQQRVRSLVEITEIIVVLKGCRDEIKSVSGNYEEDSIKQLLLACFSIVIKFFDGLKKQLKKSETYINFTDQDVGHLVHISTGHTDRPTEHEAKYIRTLLKQSGFMYEKDEPEGISPSPLLNHENFKSGILPKISSPSKQVTKNEAESKQIPNKLIKNRNSYFEPSPEPKIQVDSDPVSPAIEKMDYPKNFGIVLHKTKKMPDIEEDEQKQSVECREDSCPHIRKTRHKKNKSTAKSCRSNKTIKSVKCYASDKDDRESFYKLSIKPTKNKVNFFGKTFNKNPPGSSLRKRPKRSNDLLSAQKQKQDKSARSVGTKKHKHKAKSKMSFVPEYGPKLQVPVTYNNKSDNESPHKNSFLSSNSSLNSISTPVVEVEMVSSYNRTKRLHLDNESPQVTLCKKQQSDVKEEKKCQHIAVWNVWNRTSTKNTTQFNRFNKNFSFETQLMSSNFDLIRKDGYTLHNDSSKIAALAQQKPVIDCCVEDNIEEGYVKISKSPNFKSQSFKPVEKGQRDPEVDMTSDEK